MRIRRFLWHIAVLVGTALLTAFGAIFISGCDTRASEGAFASDSTLVYPSRRASDVGATVTFALKGSKKAEEARRAEIEAKKRADEERRAAAAEKKQDSKKKAAKKGSSKKERSAKKKPAADSDSLRAAAKDVDSGIKKAPAEKKAKPARRVEDRIFEIEDGARVQATITLSDRLARGPRPLLIHMVWVRPGGIRTYKKSIEFDPTGADSTFTGALTISPDKRMPGPYKLQVFLFRELIAEKTFTLTGTGMQEKEEGEEQM